MRRVHPPGGDAALPPGVEIYSFPADGQAIRRTRTGVSEPDGFLPFIDRGQRARYFVGDAATSPERPSNATYKLGVVRPHSAFTPHSHGGEHFVLSLGYASCGVYDLAADRAVRITLTPGTLIRIPAMMPHSFGNRAGSPLLILAANTGFGIDHEDYAITAREAENRGAEHRGAETRGAEHRRAENRGAENSGAQNRGAGNSGAEQAGAENRGAENEDDDTSVDFPALAKALRNLEQSNDPGTMTLRERIANRLRRAAYRLEAPR